MQAILDKYLDSFKTLIFIFSSTVPCVRHLNYPKQTSAEPNTTTTITSTPTKATATDTVFATTTSYPTVLAEFSSVVADTQQYIVSESGETENDLEVSIISLWGFFDFFFFNLEKYNKKYMR